MDRDRALCQTNYQETLGQKTHDCHSSGKRKCAHEQASSSSAAKALLGQGSQGTCSQGRKARVLKQAAAPGWHLRQMVNFYTGLAQRKSFVQYKCHKSHFPALPAASSHAPPPTASPSPPPPAPYTIPTPNHCSTTTTTAKTATTKVEALHVHNRSPACTVIPLCTHEKCKAEKQCSVPWGAQSCPDGCKDGPGCTHMTPTAWSRRIAFIFV